VEFLTNLASDTYVGHSRFIRFSISRSGFLKLIHGKNHTAFSFLFIHMRIHYCAEQLGPLGFDAPSTHRVIVCCREILTKAMVCPLSIHLNYLSPFVGLFNFAIFVQIKWETPSVLNKAPRRHMAVLLSMAFPSVIAFSTDLISCCSNLLRIPWPGVHVTSICSDFSYLPPRLHDRYLTNRSEIFPDLVLHFWHPASATSEK